MRAVRALSGLAVGATILLAATRWPVSFTVSRSVPSAPGAVENAGPLVRGRTLVQLFRSDLPAFNRLRLFLATYARTNRSSLELGLWRAAGGRFGEVARVRRDARLLGDNSFAEFEVPLQEDAQGAAFLLVLGSPDAGPSNATTAWLAPRGPDESVPGGAVLSVDGRERPGRAIPLNLARSDDGRLRDFLPAAASRIGAVASPQWRVAAGLGLVLFVCAAGAVLGELLSRALCAARSGASSGMKQEGGA